MLETITMPKLYTNDDVAKILGVESATIRQVKSRKTDELDGLWQTDASDAKKTFWTEEGLAKLSELIQTDEAKQFRSTALARRTQEAIAVDHAELNYPESQEISPRTGQEVSSYELPNTTASGGRYADLPENIGDLVGTTLASQDGIRRMDTQVVKSFLKAANLSDIGIDIEALLGKKS